MTHLFPRLLILRNRSACLKRMMTWNASQRRWRVRDFAGFLPSQPRRYQTSSRRRSNQDWDSFSSVTFVPCIHLTKEARVPWNCAISSFGSGTRFLPDEEEFAKREHVGVTSDFQQSYKCMTSSPTWESLRPSFAASFFLSGLLMYFCFWNIFSRAFRCTSEKTARRSIPLRGFPLAVSGHANVPGIGTGDDDAAKGGKSNVVLCCFASNTIFCVNRKQLWVSEWKWLLKVWVIRNEEAN